MIGGRQRELTNHSYQPPSYMAMDCDPSPSRHQHRQRYPVTIPIVGIGSIGSSSLLHTSYSGHTVPDGPVPNHNPQTQNGPSSSQADRDDSPMVGVCVQQSPVAIHWKISLDRKQTEQKGFTSVCVVNFFYTIIERGEGMFRWFEQISTKVK